MVAGIKNKTFVVKKSNQTEIPYQWLSDGEAFITGRLLSLMKKKITFTEGTPSERI